MWGRILALIIKELLTLLRDKKSRFILIVPPMIQLLVFGYAATFDLNNIPYALYNKDPGFASRELAARFEGSSIFQKVALIKNENQIKNLIDNKKVLMVLNINQDFTRNLLANRPAQFQVIIDGRDSNTATIALNYVNSILFSFNNYWTQAYHLPKPPSQLEIRAWFNPNLLSRWFIIPGIVATLTLLETLMMTGLSIAREREQGTFDQLLVTPLTLPGILIGKAIPGIIIGGLEGTFIACMAVIWFQVPFIGSVLALAIGMLLFLLAAAGIGLMISSLAITQQQGLLGVFLFMVPCINLSGFATPIANMPPLIQDLTYINPLRYLLIIVRGTFLEGDGVSNLISQYWPLALIALSTMSIAMWLFRHRV